MAFLVIMLTGLLKTAGYLNITVMIIRDKFSDQNLFDGLLLALSVLCLPITIILERLYSRIYYFINLKIDFSGVNSSFSMDIITGSSEEFSHKPWTWIDKLIMMFRLSMFRLWIRGPNSTKLLMLDWPTKRHLSGLRQQTTIYLIV